MRESLNILHSEEYKKYTTMKFRGRRESYLMGRLCAKCAIASQEQIIPNSDICIDSGISGFPIVRFTHLIRANVSITHSKKYSSAIAFPDEHPMGVDIELIDHMSVEASLKILSDSERECLIKINQNNITGYAIVWTMKEALIKVLRTGSLLANNAIQVTNIKFDGVEWTASYTTFNAYKAVSHVFKNYVYTIALPTATTVNLTKFWMYLDAFKP